MEKEAGDLDKVTDHHEEESKETSSSVAEAIRVITEEAARVKEGEMMRKRELALIQVKKEDIETLALEADINNDEAENVLRENKGDLLSALKSFTN